MKRLAIIAILTLTSVNVWSAPETKPSEQTAHVSDSVSGTVISVNQATGKITIKHGALKNLKMPGMTMSFKAASAQMLEQVKKGDQINFVVESINGTLTITEINVAK